MTQPFWTAEEEGRLRVLYDTGLSQSDIGLAMRRSKDSINKKIRRMGLPLREEPVNFCVVAKRLSIASPSALIAIGSRAGNRPPLPASVRTLPLLPSEMTDQTTAAHSASR